MHKRELEFFSKNLFENGQMELFNPEMPLDEQIDLLPYDSRFEFPKERLRLGNLNKIKTKPTFDSFKLNLNCRAHFGTRGIR